jgi:BMFP domain-containing protein YqiC
MSAEPRFEDFFRQVSDALPGRFFTLNQDLEKNLRAALNSAFSRMNLVTREEFEVQAALLARTRARLEELEKRVAALEKARQ